MAIKIKYVIGAVLMLCVSVGEYAYAQTPIDLNKNNKIDIYENPKYSVDERVTDLMSQMTINEKVAQMCQYLGYSKKNVIGAIVNLDETTYDAVSKSKLIDMVKEGKVGSFLSLKTQDECNTLQEASLGSRLGIPLLIGIDAIHGVAYTNEKGTVYPTQIGMASTFDPEIVEKIGAYTAKEMRSIGYEWAFSPNIEVVYNTRWGRCGETFGEDPLLVSKMGAAMIKGYQFDGNTPLENVAACAKHFVGGGLAQNGLNGSPADVSERTLINQIFPPFQEAIKMGVYSMMASHNDINGTPADIHKPYLTGMLRNQWGYKGFYVSDWNDMEHLYDIHHVAESVDDAYKLAVNAGMDMHMLGPKFYESILESVKKGLVSEERINQAAKIILTVKFKLGLFENRLTTKELKSKMLLNPEHLKLASDAAHKSIVLLKNANNSLPISKSVNHLLVTGTLANNQAILGDWATPRVVGEIPTILDAVKSSVSANTKVDFVDAGSIFSMKDEQINEAKKQAESADAVIVVVGENGQRDQAKGLQTIGENIERPILELRGKQKDLIKQLVATGKPVILVLVNGGPISTEWESANVAAIVEAWEPGMKGAQAVADVVFGDYNPSGKLPFTVPRSGMYYSQYQYKKSAFSHGKFLDAETTPIYPFGFGLSYTKFKYNNLSIADNFSNAADVPVSVEVTNTGSRAGDEVVEVFLSDEVASVTLPVKKLVAFKRISLEPGETRKVDFVISNFELSLLDTDMIRKVEAGKFQVMIGVDGNDKAFISKGFYVADK